MLNKKDPLIDAVQKVMQSNQTERAAVKAVNEKFGVQDRRVLPRERQGEWDATYQSMLAEGVDPSKYSPKQKQLAAVAGNKNKIDAPDLAAARKGGASHIKEAEKMKGDDPCWKNYKMVGMKKGKGGKPVPNCVPVSEEGDPSKAIRGDVVTGGSSVTTVPSKPSSVTPSQQDALKKKIQSIKESKKAAMCEDTLDEKITKSMPVGKVISDFVHSDNPKFAGKSKKKRMQMALGAYYSKHPEKSKKINEAQTVAGGKGDLPPGVSASPKPQTVAGGKGDLPPGVSASPKPMGTGAAGQQVSTPAPKLPIPTAKPVKASSSNPVAPVKKIVPASAPASPAKTPAKRSIQSFAQKRAVERGTAGPAAKGGFGGTTTVKKPMATNRNLPGK